MASKGLYPPIVESFYPAFVATPDAVCRVYFTLSKYNNESFTNVHVLVTKQESGLSVINKEKDDIVNNRYRATGIILNAPYGEENGKYYVDIYNDDIVGGWQPGWIYKIQIRLSEATYTGGIGQAAWVNAYADKFSEWSTSATTKSLGEVKISIPEFEFENAEGTADEYSFLASDFDFTATFSAGNFDSETLYSYQVQLYDTGYNLLEDSGILYANQYYNPNQFSYNFKYELTNNTSYILTISYETANKYTNSISLTGTIQYQEGDATTIVLLTAENDNENADMSSFTSIFMEEEEGRVALKLYSATESKNTELMIRRADCRDNFKTWTDIEHIIITGDVNSIPIVYDNTIESGVFYKYGIQKYTVDGDVITKGPLNIIENPVMRNFNYSFLLGQNGQQLKLQFNNTLSNYKVNLNEAKSVTLGGVYPFITRNGATKFKTFSLGGLISFNMDENGLFLTRKQAYKFDEIDALYNHYNNQQGISVYDYIFEKEFRDAVTEFLCDGKPKLFKSPTEGNILVRLMDVNLMPQQSLSRMIYNFSCTANEIAECNRDNYIKYGICIDV